MKINYSRWKTRLILQDLGYDVYKRQQKVRMSKMGAGEDAPET